MEEGEGGRRREREGRGMEEGEGGRRRKRERGREWKREAIYSEMKLGDGKVGSIMNRIERIELCLVVIG